MTRPLNIVLHQPQIPQNTGNIARTCAVTGCRLHLIRPMGFEVDDKKLKRAGLDYWPLLDITYYNDYEDFAEKNPGEYILFSTKSSRLYTEAEYPPGCYLIFGREDKGLPEPLLAAQYSRTARIPMLYNEHARSLNLSNSVAIAVYEALRQNGFNDLKTAGALNMGIEK